MDPLELLERMSVALGIGLLIGLERGWQQRREPAGERSVGLRTIALASMLGGVWGSIAARLSSSGGAVALGIAFLVFAVAIMVFRLRESIHDRTYGATTVVAAMLAFSLGAFALVGDVRVAAASGVAATALLALKEVLHGWVERLTWAELRSGLVLLAMTFVLLPFLPNRTVDPWSAVNPYELWLMTILIAMISFAGYVAVKLAGEERGIVLTGIAGGVVSSTAVTVTLARLAREHPERMPLLLGGAHLANATMFGRILAVAAAINSGLLTFLALPLLLAGCVFAVAGLFAIRNVPVADGTSRLNVGNPFDLATVLKFGALLTMVTLLAKTLTAGAGTAGAYSLAALSGIADVDAITLAMARYGAEQLGETAAGIAILVAAASNTLSKTVLAWVSGGARLGGRMAVVSTLALAAGFGGLWLSATIRL